MISDFILLVAFISLIRTSHDEFALHENELESNENDSVSLFYDNSNEFDRQYTEQNSFRREQSSSDTERNNEGSSEFSLIDQQHHSNMHSLELNQSYPDNRIYEELQNFEYSILNNNESISQYFGAQTQLNLNINFDSPSEDANFENIIDSESLSRLPITDAFAQNTNLHSEEEFEKRMMENGESSIANTNFDSNSINYYSEFFNKHPHPDLPFRLKLKKRKKVKNNIIDKNSLSQRIAERKKQCSLTAINNQEENEESNFLFIEKLKSCFTSKNMLTLFFAPSEFIEKRKIFHNIESLITEELEKSMNNFQNESYLKMSSILRDYMKRNFNPKSLCIFCASHLKNINIEENEVFLFEICKNIANSLIKKAVSKLLSYGENNHQQETSIFKAAEHFTQRRVELKEVCKLFGFKIPKMLLPSKRNLLHVQIHRLIQDNMKIKLILLPELHSIIYTFFQTPVFHTIKDNKTFLSLWAALDGVNRFMAQIDQKNQLAQMRESYSTEQQEVILGWLTFILRLYFIEPIVNYLKIRKYALLRYRIVTLEIFALTLQKFNGAQINEVRMCFLLKTIKVLLVCRRIMDSNQFLDIYQKNDYLTFYAENIDRLHQYEIFAKQHSNDTASA